LCAWCDSRLLDDDIATRRDDIAALSSTSVSQAHGSLAERSLKC
jgi:hypothetical protein